MLSKTRSKHIAGCVQSQCAALCSDFLFPPRCNFLIARRDIDTARPSLCFSWSILEITHPHPILQTLPSGHKILNTDWEIVRLCR